MCTNIISNREEKTKTGNKMHMKSIRKDMLWEKNYILVIDEGTTGTRAILFDKKFRLQSSHMKNSVSILRQRIW